MSGFGLRPRALDLVLVAAPPAAIVLGPLASNDLPMHLAIGEWILDRGTLPASDPFSFTAGGAAWVPHEWMAGVLFALAERAGGVAGLEVVAVLGAALLAWSHRAVTSTLR